MQSPGHMSWDFLFIKVTQRIYLSSKCKNCFQQNWTTKYSCACASHWYLCFLCIVHKE